MASQIQLGVPGAVPEPSIHDLELAYRILALTPLRPIEELAAQCPSPALAEALYRVKHGFAARLAATRAAFLQLAPQALEVIGDGLINPDPRVRLQASKQWKDIALPAAPVQVQHSLAPAERQLSTDAVAAFGKLTTELVKKLQHTRDQRDILSSKHVLRGADAKPTPGLLERPDHFDNTIDVEPSR